MARDSRLMGGDPVVDLELVEAMVAELEDYIIKNDVDRTLTVRPSQGDENIRMTGGDLLARLHRLQGERDALTPAQQARLDAAQKAAETTIYSLRTRFHQRLQREMKARLDSLRWFLDDCRSDLQRCRTEFPFEMRNRQRIEEILKELGQNVPSELTDLLRQIDKRIKEVANEQGFTWDERLEKVYPRDTYWYLYVRP